MEAFSRIRNWYETSGRQFAQRVARLLLRPFGSINPNVVTVLGCVLSAVAAWLLVQELFLWASIVFLIGSAFDALDGAIAKVSGRATEFGAFLDSTLDRVSEGLVLIGACLMFAQRDTVELVPIAACCVAIASSFLVSYTRARAEAIGVRCTGGLASRTERVLVLGAGILLSAWWPSAIAWAVIIVALVATLTVVQRVHLVHAALRKRP